MIPGFGNSGGTGKLIPTALQSNGIAPAGLEINLSPESYFFADDHTLYVADSGAPKNDSATNDAGSTLGDGGLQKWSLVTDPKTGKQSWVLDYTLSAGLNLVPNTDAAGTTGLLGLTGKVLGDGEVELFATNYTIGDTDPTFLYGIMDQLNATSGAGESFVQLAAAPADSNFKGVSFAPVPEPAAWALMIGGFGLVGAAVRRRRVAAA
ncbi:MAG: PEPxxWA-CTERM sorting domain-containing protein [Proteobacteria bacterium]|nr:PEPxxWA-CTERM sorting domain-containing protein [Pseudomonadota bacterium]